MREQFLSRTVLNPNTSVYLQQVSFVSRAAGGSKKNSRQNNGEYHERSTGKNKEVVRDFYNLALNLRKPKEAVAR